VDLDSFNLLSIPGTSRLPRAPAAKIVEAAASICEERRAFYIVDAPASLTSTTITAWKEQMRATPNAGLYFPGLRVEDRFDSDAIRDVPPSGAIAGVIARTDMARGVWKAPAGTDARLQGVRGLNHSISDTERGHFTAHGVNTLRTFPGQGIRVWGSRTLASAADTDFNYVSVRRLLLFIEESLDRGIQWAVFEPNDEPLWRAVRRSIENFLLGLFKSGALMGRRPEDAYFVRCDRMTMTEEDIDKGRLICLVGVAPVRPAEFLSVSHVTRLGQSPQ
jgi:phage tail sheath protein FI